MTPKRATVWVGATAAAIGFLFAADRLLHDAAAWGTALIATIAIAVTTRRPLLRTLATVGFIASVGLLIAQSLDAGALPTLRI